MAKDDLKLEDRFGQVDSLDSTEADAEVSGVEDLLLKAKQLPDLSIESTRDKLVIKKRAKRSGLSSSPYVNPTSLIHMLAKQVQEYIYFPEPLPLYMTLGVLAANMMAGVPVWVMVVGPSSGGKTLVLDMLEDIDRVHFEGALKGQAAFLSGSAKKDTAKNATGGVLRQFQPLHDADCTKLPGCRCIGHGLLVVKDFSEVLSQDHSSLVETIGMFRGMADGKCIRSIGGEGGKKMIWRGKVGFLGACTPKIDGQHSVIQELGQRWLYYRYEQTNGFGEAQKSLGNQDREKMNRELSELVRGFVDMQGLEWGMKERREFERGEVNKFIAMSSVIVKARSRSSRDWKTKEVVDIDDSEAPSRMASALGQLFLGLEALGLESSYCWKIVQKMAWDSCPRLSTAVLGVVASAAKKKGPVGLKEIKGLGGLMCSNQTIARTVEDLEIFGLVKLVGGLVELTGEARGDLKTGWGY